MVFEEDKLKVYVFWMRGRRQRGFNDPINSSNRKMVDLFVQSDSKAKIVWNHLSNNRFPPSRE